MPSKKAAGKAGGAPARRPRKPKVAPESRGLAPHEVAKGHEAPGVAELVAAIESDGGTVLGSYRDPFGGHGLVLAALPLGRVEPTPFQRDLSKPHAERLAKAMTAVDRFLDPIVAVRREDGRGYWTPNGLHRTQALKALGARTVIALVVPEREVAYRILALNTEKAHTLREKALEVIRMARDLAALDRRHETEHAVTFEDPVLLTLGLAYEARPRFAGSVYQPVLRRVETFLGEPLSAALDTRARRVATLLELDDLVAAAVAALEAKGLESPYLKSFVVARVNPIRFSKTPTHPFDPTIAKMIESARAFDAGKVRPDQVARSGGPPASAEG
jgi:ParB family chromosome partitioning protein